MFASWKIGRIAGIDVFLHPTFLLVLLPGFGFGGPLMILCIFGCVLLHELGHALMARRFGIRTADITLYPIGGVARLERMPRARGAELLIALAGPAVNFTIIGILTVLSLVGLDEAVAGTFIGEMLYNLLVINLVQGTFNLIPAFPMDGGRVLRALLSGWLGRARATSVAAKIGRGLALMFGIFGIYVLATVGNPFPLALSAFIYFIACVEERQVLYEERQRQFPDQDQGIWTAPAGYRWVNQGDGIWKLAPIIVRIPQHGQGQSQWN